MTAVPRAPQSLPFAYTTCRIASRWQLSLPVVDGAKKVVLLWLAMPATVVLQFGWMTVSAMHSPSGRLPAGCVAGGGTAYSLDGDRRQRERRRR